MSDISNPVNPDPALYAMSGSAFILRPKQCPKCFNLFTPADVEQEKCKECSDMTKENEKALRKELSRLVVKRSYYRERKNEEKAAVLTQEIESLRGQLKGISGKPATTRDKSENPYTAIIESAKELHAQLLDDMAPCNIESVRVDKESVSILSDGISIHVRITKNG